MGFGFQAKKTMHDLHVWDGQNGKAYEENEQPYAGRSSNGITDDISIISKYILSVLGIDTD
jgi:hypothetical protein